MLRIYDSNKELELISKREIDLKIEHDLSTGDKTISFLVPVDSEEAEKLVEEGYIETKELNLVVKEINRNFKSFNVVAKLNVEELEGKYIKKFEAVEMTVDNTINSILVGTGWSIVACNVTKKRTTRRENKNAWDLIQEVKKIFNCEITFDSKNKQIRIYESLGSYKGEYIRDDINLINLSAQTDSYDFYTRLEAEGKDGLTFADLNNGKSYVENYSHSSKVLTYFWKDERYTKKESLLEDARAKLAELASPKKSYSCDAVDLSNNIALGDTIELVSKKLKVKEKQRVVKYVEYPSNPANNYVELSNTLINLEDINNKFEKASDLIEDVTNADGTINIDKVSGLVVKVTELTADKINTTQLNAVIADIGTLRASKADITELNAVKANITELTATKASITQLNAVSATIGSLQAETAIIKDLVNGNLTSDNIHSLVLSAEKVTVVNGFIKNAMIDNLDVSKINGGTISTDKFIIKSNDGGIEITGATQQFKDKNNRVRLQLGKDTQGNFNFILRGEDGTTTLIDHTGLKRGAIADGLIINNMLGTGSITGDKVNIGSIVSEVNKDTNTTTIKATKIQLDKEGQTLDIAFNTLKTNVNDIEIGGRNLLEDTKITKEIISIGEANKTGAFYNLTENSSYIQGKQCFVQYEWEYVGNTPRGTFRCQTGPPQYGVIGSIIEISTSNSSGKVSLKWKPSGKTSFKQLFFRTDNMTGTLNIKKIKLELGDRGTDWTEAPEDVETRIETNTTQITAQQGKIETLISDTTIIEDGTSKKLKDAYASLKLTVNGLNSTVGSHTSSITTMNGQITTANGNIVALQGKVQTVEGKQSTFEQTLNGITQRVTSSESNVTTLQGQMTTANNNITNANNKIDGMKIGSDNLVRNTDFEKGTNSKADYWDLMGGNVASSYSASSPLLGNKKYMMFANNDSVERFIKSARFTLKPNTEYICSFYAHTDMETEMDVYILYSNIITNEESQDTNYDVAPNKQKISTNNNWIKTEFKFTTNSTAKTGYIRIDNNTGGGKRVRVGLLKLEEGNKATAWCKSSKDIEADIKAVDVKMEATSSKVAEIKTTVDGISQKVSATDTKVVTLQGQMTTANNNITNTNNKLDGLQIGGRNFAENSNFAKGNKGWVLSESGTIDTNTKYLNANTLKLSTSGQIKDVWWGASQKPVISNPILNKEYTISFMYLVKDKSILDNGFSVEIKGGNATSGGNIGVGGYKLIFADGIKENVWSKSTQTFKLTNSEVTYLYLFPWIRRNGEVWITNIKIEEGNKATDWTPSPEDVEADINAVDIKIEATSSKVAEIKTTVDGISQKVSATDTKVTAIDGKITTATGDISTLKGQVTATNSKVASIESTVNGISSKVSSVESSVTTINGNITSLTSRMTTAEQKITADSIINTITSSSVTSDGKMLFTDPTFKYGTNGVKVYNNASNGVVVINRITKQSDCPTSSTHALEIKTTGGGATPGNGGFCFGNTARANAIFLYKFTAKIPTGCTLKFGTNSIGTGGESKWLTENKGTGKYKEYIYRVNCGDSGSFSTTGYFSISGGALPLTWYLASATAIDLSDVSDLTSELNGLFNNGAVLNTVSTTLDKNGFTVKNGAIRIQDSSGNTMLEGDTTGALYLRKLLNVGSVATVSATDGIKILNNKLKVTDSLSIKNTNTTSIAHNGIEFLNDILGEEKTGSIKLENGRLVFRNSDHGSIGYFDFNGNIKAEKSITAIDNVTVGKALTANTSVTTPKHYVHSQGDLTNNAPWYGMGESNLKLGGTGNAIQFSGYWGARLRSNTYVLDMPFNKEPEFNSGVFFNGWVRPKGQNGIYFQDYGGGWNMTDSSWIRAYGGKGIFTNGKIECNGTLQCNNTIIAKGNSPFVAFYNNSGTRVGYVGNGSTSNNSIYLCAENDNYIKCLGHLVPTATKTFWIGTNSPDQKWKGLIAEGGTVGSSDIITKENIERVDGTLLSYNEATKEIKEFQLNHFRRIERATEKDYYSFVKDRFKPTYYNYKLGEAMGEDGELSIDTETEYNMLKNVGFIAQDYDIETDLVAKEFIIKDEEGQLSYNHMSYVTVGMIALQEAIKKIEILEDKIKRLEAS